MSASRFDGLAEQDAGLGVGMLPKGTQHGLIQVLCSPNHLTSLSSPPLTACRASLTSMSGYNNYPAPLRQPHSTKPIDRSVIDPDAAAAMRARSQSTSGSSSPYNSDSDPRSESPSSMSSMSSTSTVSSDKARAFFRPVCGRDLNTMNPSYMLPSDEAELKRLDQEHRMIKFVLNANYVGNVKEVLASTKDKDKRILDCGTGSGIWCVEVAEEFPNASVIGVDLAPIQPREVPPNCRFELFDLDGQQLPYPDQYFDVIHCRSVYMGIRNYPLFLRECARVLRKNGMIILAEADTQPMTDNKRLMSPDYAPGWTTLWNEYRRGLTMNGFDVTIPTRLRPLLQEIPSLTENVVAQEALIPVGFWPKDPVLLTIGQLSWMNQDNLLPGLVPQFVKINGMTEEKAKQLVEAAQKDLYFPQIRPFVCWHFAHARKMASR